MSEFVGTIRVHATQAAWRAEEVPDMTASALFRFEPEPDPEIPKTELRRFNSAEPSHRDAGRKLTARELAGLDRLCKAAGLGELPATLRYSRWDEYVDAVNHGAKSRGWWAGVNPPRDPHHGERFGWVIAAEEHRELLKKAITSGDIQARMTGTMVPATLGKVNLQHLVLTRSELKRFAEGLSIEVVDMPHFKTCVCPGEVPPELLALAPDARITYEHSIAGWQGSGECSAKEYGAEIEATIARQGEGFFTLNEAAQVLADEGLASDPIETVKRFKLAHSKGGLRIYKREGRFRLEAGETVRDFHDLLKRSDLDAWLRDSAGYGFPFAVVEAAAPRADYSILATRDGLVKAFGPFTGIDASWFRNLKDTPELQKARKIKGTGGRGHTTEPWFCPYEVMKWLVNPKRKKGRRMNEATGWRTLKAHFLAVYEAHELEARTPD